MGFGEENIQGAMVESYDCERQMEGTSEGIHKMGWSHNQNVCLALCHVICVHCVLK